MSASTRKRSLRAGTRRHRATLPDRRIRRDQVRFAIKFLVAAAVLFSLYSFPYAEAGISEAWFQSYLRGYAQLAGSILALFDHHVGVAGTVIAGRYSLRIVKTCDAMEANLLFLAALIAFPARWRRKVVAAVAGIAVLVGVNLVRICSLYFVGLYLPARFELVHAELWPLVLVVVAIVDFALLALWIAREPARAAAPAVESS